MLSLLKEKAKGLGFIAVGFSRPGRPLHLDPFHKWISERKHADMSWLERHLGLRSDPSKLLKGCQTIISLAYPYLSQKPGTWDGFSASRYTQPPEEDYHNRLRTLCGELCKVIKERYKGCKTRICVDSAPILERSYAHAGGMGFIGKNNMMIIPGYGSFFYLAEILTTVPLEFPPVKPMENQCGSCIQCMEVCPGGAIEKPFYLDASKCLSYLTIEYGGPLRSETGKGMGDCFFGCDRCQEVCPFNEGDFSLRISLPSTDDLLRMGAEAFRRRFGKTAFARAGLEKIKRNIAVIRG